MRICVITPYYKEERESLERCLQSVVMQTHPCTHMLVSDGHPQAWLDERDIRHVKLGVAHADYGDTPRAIGSLLAAAEGFDAVAFLDADNCFLPAHVEGLVAAQRQTGAAVVTSRRALVAPDLSILGVPDDQDEGQTTFCDSNCYLITRAAFSHIQRLALKPRQLSIIGDRLFWRSLLSAGVSVHRSTNKTVCYFTLWRSHYIKAGVAPPHGAKAIEGQQMEDLKRWWRSNPPEEQQRIQSILGYNFSI